MWVAPGGPVGGVTKLEAGASEPSSWTGNVKVANVANTVARTATLGGKILVPTTDAPGGMRFAILADPQGGVFGVYQSADPDEVFTPKPRGSLGEFSWSELMTVDPEGAHAFYSELFGWVKTNARDMGEMGNYQMFGLVQEANSMGGMMRAPPGMPTAWLHYSNVADCEVAVAKVRELGGSVMHGPVAVTGGGRMATCCDPQGAWFALYAEK